MFSLSLSLSLWFLRKKSSINWHLALVRLQPTIFMLKFISVDNGIQWEICVYVLASLGSSSSSYGAGASAVTTMWVLFTNKVNKHQHKRKNSNNNDQRKMDTKMRLVTEMPVSIYTHTRFLSSSPVLFSGENKFLYFSVLFVCVSFNLNHLHNL